MLSPKNQRVFNFIQGYIASNKAAPTMKEIGEHFQMSSSASVHAILKAIEREGLIRRTPHVKGGIEIVAQPTPAGARATYAEAV